MDKQTGLARFGVDGDPTAAGRVAKGIVNEIVKHAFEQPGAALDDRMAKGLIDVSLPYVKKVGLEVLTEAENQEKPQGYIAETMLAHFEENHSEVFTEKRVEIDEAVETVQAIFKRNVFPTMGVTWNTYPINIGHEQYIGCFRCHDESHATPEGETIRQDCDMCHYPLAIGETDPDIISQLGIE